MKQALAEKDERMRKELEQVRNELLQKIKKIERDRDRLSREYAEKKAEADERVRKIQEGLKAEKAEREERQREAAPSVNKADKSPLNVSTVGALQRLTANPRGFFALLGRAIESMFGH
ncbi:uncharacterized protein PHACADRAFT_27059 [Phanerochaete carnosa HHB-10118-sp]|uniref:GRIP domain-containing protein n=1 Tax=Phanerochaete carnosa (strain HHB-10118-sp) TaxID=650164 RepID=K5WHJ4_PHACS|nr:uncharacterized protein PHACADRAFT_27059 [Phanerochaete carnosa HHB-10118-sp]EKM58589.1 hypothetical protein PHACADRAFT_27059 [Phanerochaete carnosa HHB-10118-sp]